jgi:hypothetical protein
LETPANCWVWTPRVVEVVLRPAIIDGVEDPWAFLGLEPGTSYREAKATWLRRVQLIHPDKHAGADPRLLGEANRALAQLNQAWDQIERSLRNDQREPDQTSRDRNNATASESSPRSHSGAGTSERGSSTTLDFDEEIGFLVDAVEQGALAEKIRLSPAELSELRRPFSAITSGDLLERVARALFVVMLLDAHDDPIVRVDRDVALPSSWVETYEFFADLDDPPCVFVLTEEAARLLCSVYG